MKKMAKASAMTPRMPPMIIYFAVSTTADGRRRWNWRTGMILLDPLEDWVGSGEEGSIFGPLFPPGGPEVCESWTWRRSNVPGKCIAIIERA
jgi:hypothetical protein